MKKLIYSFAFMLMATMPAAAQQVDGDALNDSIEINQESSYGDKGNSSKPGMKKTASTAPLYSAYNEHIITYQSIDGNKQPITLSAKVYLRDIDWRLILPNAYQKIKHILLSCHPTVTSNSEVPTGSTPVDGAILRMTDHDGGVMVVCPDYCGYGVSSYAQHPYLIHDITARNCIDAVKEAIEKVKKGEFRIDPILGDDHVYELGDYSTDIVGYSQGGATALACAKYLESEACPQETKDLIKYRRTTCGDGPYSIRATLNQYVEWGMPTPPTDPTKGKVRGTDWDRDLEYPCVLPLIVAAAKDAYQDGCMKTVEVEDFFAPDFLEETNIMTMIRSKSTTTSDINSQVKRIWVDGLGRRLRPVDIFSENIIKSDGTYNTETEQYKCLQRVMDWAELASGWNPQHPITFFHLKKDGVVPYKNYEAVRDGIHYKTTNGVFDLDAAGNKIPNPKVDLIENAEEYSKDSNWRGVFAWLNQAPAKEDIELLNHAEGGTLFYVIYMFYMVDRQ